MDERPPEDMQVQQPSPEFMALGIGAQAWLRTLSPEQRADAARAVREIIDAHLDERPKVVALLPLPLREAIESDLQAACTWWSNLLESVEL